VVCGCVVSCRVRWRVCVSRRTRSLLVLSLAHEQIAAGRKSLSLAQLVGGRACRDQVSDLSTQWRAVRA
jgi:hypothetical protein